MSRRTMEYTGPLAAALAEFRSLMRSTGAPHGQTLLVVKRLDRFLATHYPQLRTLTRDVIRAWFATFEHLKFTSQSRYRTATFQVCKFLRSRNPGTATREDFEPFRRSRTFKPYILSVGQVATLLQGARKVAPRPSDPLRPHRLELVIGLLYAAGLRIGEVIRLLVRDYDYDSATLTIRETKFAKSRIVPLSGSAQALVESYLDQRARLGLNYKPEDPLLCGPRGRPPCRGSTQTALAHLMRRCGLKPERGRGGPRVHDIRHTFAVHRLLQWYREGRDVQALLARLVTYMGHRGLESTQLYLSVTPEVLHEASTRFERFARLGFEPEEVMP